MILSLFILATLAGVPSPGATAKFPKCETLKYRSIPHTVGTKIGEVQVSELFLESANLENKSLHPIYFGCLKKHGGRITYRGRFLAVGGGEMPQVPKGEPSSGTGREIYLSNGILLIGINIGLPTSGRPLDAYYPPGNVNDKSILVYNQMARLNRVEIVKNNSVGQVKFMHCYMVRQQEERCRTIIAKLIQDAKGRKFSTRPIFMLAGSKILIFENGAVAVPMKELARRCNWRSPVERNFWMRFC